MVESVVKISMRDDNDLGCSYAVVSKNTARVIIILRGSECAVFNYDVLKGKTFNNHYLLLKHYPDDAQAYTDFLKLIGKMCKKQENSKYFMNPINEDNRMVRTTTETEHMMREDERPVFEERFSAFQKFVYQNRQRF